jgi:hypothetical protein
MSLLIKRLQLQIEIKAPGKDLGEGGRNGPTIRIVLSRIVLLFVSEFTLWKPVLDAGFAACGFSGEGQRE